MNTPSTRTLVFETPAHAPEWLDIEAHVDTLLTLSDDASQVLARYGQTASVRVRDLAEETETVLRLTLDHLPLLRAALDEAEIWLRKCGAETAAEIDAREEACDA